MLLEIAGLLYILTITRVSIWPDSHIDSGNLAIIAASQIDLHTDALQHFNIIGLSF